MRYSPNKMEGAISASCHVTVAPSGRTQGGSDWGWIPSDHAIHLELIICSVCEGRAIDMEYCKSIITTL